MPSAFRGRFATPGRVAAAVTFALVLSACSHVHVIGADRTLRLALTEYRLRPQDIRMRAGLLTIFVHNYGRLTHNLVLSISGSSAGSTGPLLPGQSTELSLYLTPGHYLMASKILSDQALGEYGTLTGTGAASRNSATPRSSRRAPAAPG
jgi:hypothetical protein